MTGPGWTGSPAATVHSYLHTSRNSKITGFPASGTNSTCTGAASSSGSGTAAASVLPQLQEVMLCMRHLTKQLPSELLIASTVVFLAMLPTSFEAVHSASSQ